MVSAAREGTRIAYFSMEIGVDPAMPTYSGGLGVLAGDSVRAAADLEIPVVAVTLLHRKGYFHQRLDAAGAQTELPASWSPEQILEPLEAGAVIAIEGRPVQIRVWRYIVQGITGYKVPIYLLDTAVPDNDPEDQVLTDRLYGGDSRYRLRQEAVLGIGGIAVLRALGYDRIRTYHMNEGHSGLLALALLEERIWGRSHAAITDDDIEAVRGQCVFTVHTPVPAGHDRFPTELVRHVLGPQRTALVTEISGQTGGDFDLTYFAMSMCRNANGVSLRHGQVSREMFPQYEIGAITNGVHAGAWVSEPLAAFYDAWIPRWRIDNRYLRHAVAIPLADIRRAHSEAKQALMTEVDRRTIIRLNPEAFTIGFARRATAYKRADLLFNDLSRLSGIVASAGPLQVIFSGKAHPRDESGKAIIRRIFEVAHELRDVVRIVYLEDYDMQLARYLVSGVDLWLNTPQKPLEASGTSGMKAALNGVPSLSVLDGWWIEGHIEGVTGWSIGDDYEPTVDERSEAHSLYDKLERTILPMFYKRPDEYAAVMRSAIAVNGSFFNAQRMMGQYLRNVYEYTNGIAPHRD